LNRSILVAYRVTNLDADLAVRKPFNDSVAERYPHVVGYRCRQGSVGVST
jgi:hypothetical protein